MKRLASLILSACIALSSFGASATMPGIEPVMGQNVALVTNTDESVNSGSDNPYVFTTQAFGAEAWNRHIIVGYCTSVSGRTVSSATIGGVSATKFGETLSADSGTTCGFLIAAVPTGTTGTVSITLNFLNARMGIGVWRVTGLRSATPTATATDTSVTSDALSNSIAIPAGGIALGNVYAANGTVSWAWTNLSENFDHDVGGGRIQSGALEQNVRTASTPTITAQGGASTPSGGAVLVLGAWR